MKPWYQSKSIWLAIIQTLLGILALVATFLEIASFTAPAIVMLVMAALQVVIRVWFTDTQIQRG